MTNKYGKYELFEIKISGRFIENYTAMLFCENTMNLAVGRW